MRDLINLIDSVVKESVGLANRKPGEQFKNHVNDVITFQSLNFYPESGRYDTPEELQAGLNQTQKELNIGPQQIHWTNAPSKKTGAFGIVTFTGEDGTPYYLGKWYNSISPNRVENSWPNNDIPGGFKYQGRSGKKEATGYKPSEVLTQFKDNTPETIRNQIIAKFGADTDEARAVDIFMNSNIPCKIPRGNINPDAFRDYFMEMLQPMALVMGKNVSGNAAEAAKIFFGKGQGYNECTISFNDNTIGGLYDSLLVNPDGKQIKLSSKGKDGATASVTNLRKSVSELENTAAGKKLLSKYADTIDILDTIERLGHFGAPLALAVQFDMIDQDEATQVMSLKGLGPKDEIVGSGRLSDRLEKMYSKRKAKDPTRVIPIEHMISAIAYPLADYINKNTDFSQAASDILNNAALVQMYTDTSVSADFITITKLTAVYPSQTVTGVLLDASKVYFSTGGKGNFTFEILKNGAKAKDINPVDPLEQPKDIEKSILDYEPRRSDIKAADTANLTAKSDRETLGRRRR